jgi:hypothetical protein
MKEDNFKEEKIMGTEFEENQEYIYEVNESYEPSYENNENTTAIASSILVSSILPPIFAIGYMYVGKILQYFLFVVLLILTCGLSGTMGVPEPLSFEIVTKAFFRLYLGSICLMIFFYMIKDSLEKKDDKKAKISRSRILWWDIFFVIIIECIGVTIWWVSKLV